MMNEKLSRKLTPSAEEIVLEISFCPGSIQTLQLEEYIDAFAVVKDYCRDIMYVRVEAAATITQQVQDAAAIIRDICDNHTEILQGLNVTFYFNKRIDEKCKTRLIEQTYSFRLQEYIGDGFHRKYYNASENLKLEFMINPATLLQEQAEIQKLKTA